jgi:hypothetical protein
VQQALAKKFPNSNFLVADVETGRTAGRVRRGDLIDLLRPPFRRYWSALPQSGMIIISIYRYRRGLRTVAIWRTPERQRVSTYASRIVNEHGQIWDVRVFARGA